MNATLILRTGLRCIIYIIAVLLIPLIYLVIIPIRWANSNLLGWVDEFVDYLGEFQCLSRFLLVLLIPFSVLAFLGENLHLSWAKNGVVLMGTFYVLILFFWTTKILRKRLKQVSCRFKRTISKVIASLLKKDYPKKVELLGPDLQSLSKAMIGFFIVLCVNTLYISVSYGILIGVSDQNLNSIMGPIWKIILLSSPVYLALCLWFFLFPSLPFDRALMTLLNDHGYENSMKNSGMILVGNEYARIFYDEMIVYEAHLNEHDISEDKARTRYFLKVVLEVIWLRLIWLFEPIADIFTRINSWLTKLGL